MYFSNADIFPHPSTQTELFSHHTTFFFCTFFYQRRHISHAFLPLCIKSIHSLSSLLLRSPAHSPVSFHSLYSRRLFPRGAFPAATSRGAVIFICCRSLPTKQFPTSGPVMQHNDTNIRHYLGENAHPLRVLQRRSERTRNATRPVKGVDIAQEPLKDNSQ